MNGPDEAKGEGEQAFHAGESETANPYPPATDEHLSWNDGWMGANDGEQGGN
jgi:hypothetical protein